MNIILCGMMGAGKTTVGIKISDLTGMRWYDTDDLITQKYGKISGIFEFYGEERFREIESEIVRGIAGEDNCVISTGGCCVLKPSNSAAFTNGGGEIVFLKVDIETLFARTGHTGDERPLLKNTTFEKMKELLDFRTPIYEGCADYTVDTNGKNVDEVAREIVSVFNLPLLRSK